MRRQKRQLTTMSMNRNSRTHTLMEQDMKRRKEQTMNHSMMPTLESKGEEKHPNRRQKQTPLEKYTMSQGMSN